MESLIHLRKGKTPRRLHADTNGLKDDELGRGGFTGSTAGWRGGGSLSVFYQQQARHPTITATTSGDGPDLTELGLIPADGIMLLAAHLSRHGTMTEWLDASILDESDPAKRDPELDLYDADNPNQPPHAPEFLDRYREAQVARNRRITKWVKDKLAELKARGRAVDGIAVGVVIAPLGELLFGAIGHPDKELHEIPGANHYYAGPDQRATLRAAVDGVTDGLHRHGFSGETP